jgi:uroporphyrinogen-III decarboxylase
MLYDRNTLVSWNDTSTERQDFTRHNEEAKAVWEAYHVGNPMRVPVTLWSDARYFLLDPVFNPRGAITFEDFIEQADVMMDVQLRGAEWRAQTVSLCCDDQAGPPQEFQVTVDMLRFFDAGFFGCKLSYRDGQMPDTTPILVGDRKNLLFDRGLPHPLKGGIFTWAHRMYDKMVSKIEKNFTYHGKAVRFVPFGLGTDGPLTVATSLRGAELYLDFYSDPDYVHQLLDFITAGTIARVQAHRQFFGLPLISEDWGYADDAVQMLSTEMVREFVLPYHQKLKDALTSAEQVSLHLCGNATRHFKMFRDEIGVNSFDTGFPIDFAWIRQEVGPAVEIQGGVRAPQLANGTPDEICAEARRILASGIMEGGRFILKEANDLVPCTPLENLNALYQTARTYGVY